MRCSILDGIMRKMRGEGNASVKGRIGGIFNGRGNNMSSSTDELVGLAGTLITLKVVSDIADNTVGKKKKGSSGLFDMNFPKMSKKSKGGLYDL
jgi:hypothetical protein